MTNMLRSVLTVGALALSTAAGLTAAKADVVRVAIVMADSAADYAANAAMAPTFVAMLKKGGAKDVVGGTDEAKMAIMTTSVWPDEAAITAVTGSADWKAEAAKLKAKSYVIEVFKIAP